MAISVQYAHPRLRKQKNVLRKDIFVGGSHTSIVRETRENAATIGVSLVILGLPWGPLWP